MYLIIYLTPIHMHTHSTHTRTKKVKEIKTLQPGNQPSEVSNSKKHKKRWHCETVALWNSLVTWKLAQYPYDVIGSPTVKSVTCGCCVDTIHWGFVMGIRTNIHGLAAFPVLLLIHMENPHHNGNVVYR